MKPDIVLEPSHHEWCNEPADAGRQGMTAMDSTMQIFSRQADPTVEARLRPLVVLMATLYVGVAGLLVTTVSLGASPLNDSAYALGTSANP